MRLRLYTNCCFRKFTEGLFQPSIKFVKRIIHKAGFFARRNPYNAISNILTLSYGLAGEAVTYAGSYKKHCKPRIKFFIFADYGRTGSSLLTDLLNKHPLIHCDDEILEFPTLCPILLVKQKARLATREVYGFKVFLSALKQPRKFVERFYRDGWKIIFLDRKNKLRQVISLSSALERGRFHYYTQEAGQIKKIRLDPEKVLWHLKKIVRMETLLNSVLQGMETCNVIYEDGLEKEEMHQPTANGIFRFLGIPESPVYTNFVKISPPALVQIIENYEEIKEAAIRAGYGRYTQ